jgi:hypothetical protein
MPTFEWIDMQSEIHMIYGFNNASASEHSLRGNSEISLTMKRTKDRSEQKNQKGANKLKL